MKASRKISSLSCSAHEIREREDLANLVGQAALAALDERTRDLLIQCLPELKKLDHSSRLNAPVMMQTYLPTVLKTLEIDRPEKVKAILGILSEFIEVAHATNKQRVADEGRLYIEKGLKLHGPKFYLLELSRIGSQLAASLHKSVRDTSSISGLRREYLLERVQRNIANAVAYGDPNWFQDELMHGCIKCLTSAPTRSTVEDLFALSSVVPRPDGLSILKFQLPYLIKEQKISISDGIARLTGSAQA